MEPTRSGGTSEFMAKKVQKNDVIFRQISGFNRVLFSPFPWENDPGCQIVFIWRLKPTNSDTIVLHFAGNLNICVSFFMPEIYRCIRIHPFFVRIFAFIVHYLHTHYVCFNMFTYVHVDIFVYLYIHKILLCLLPIINKIMQIHIR